MDLYLPDCPEAPTEKIGCGSYSGPVRVAPSFGQILWTQCLGSGLQYALHA